MLPVNFYQIGFFPGVMPVKATIAFRQHCRARLTYPQIPEEAERWEQKIRAVSRGEADL
jgi:hypothetical protein